MKAKTQTGILLLSHGPFAASLLEAAKMICGDIAKAEALAFYEGDNTDIYGGQIRQKLEEYGEGTLVLVDLFGGTPFNQLVSKCHDLNFAAVAGVNLPMLLEAVYLRDQYSGQELIDKTIEAGSTSIYDVNKFLKDVQNAESKTDDDLLDDLL